jgi:hypothetical protein
LLPLSSHLNLLFSNASSGFNYIAYALPYKRNEAVQILLCNLLPFFLNCLLHLLLRIRPIMALGKPLLYNLLESFNWVKIGANWWLIKYRNLIGFKLGSSRLSYI